MSNLEIGERVQYCDVFKPAGNRTTCGRIVEFRQGRFAKVHNDDGTDSLIGVECLSREATDERSTTD